MLCVCVCVRHSTPRRRGGGGVLQHFPPECDCQWASLSLAVWQDARIISGHGGSERGSGVKEKRGARGRDCLSRPRRVLISVLRALRTQQCTLLSVTQSPHRRDPIRALLLAPTLTPSFRPASLIDPAGPFPHISRAVALSLKHGALQIFHFIHPALPSAPRRLRLASSVSAPLLPFSPHSTLLFAPGIIAS